ncbi:very long-chain-fatty-acid--CoA ligase bubblegum [Topomyia yanbarensis]|uniref:very long-chain-fatty-acid--CoA ligase bubblegum n=1 Tax=Topomyia yanbarensis TaxID=2498891 RepID=UPI00273C5C72|nr:very long-chain-fatty-acid--CoA ligase bubblegum [Topomyia yanbarensis]XP_058821299.1 very long-chain-fatty-acid--CoA ligase bubblegum [Topomyia yanbarensis]XP_058821300.1 very long-chain-fatty-acid--CoA ligase bubblegum [Topomyia yanbarensis]XP_058821301.1 very long-chain-fatty-acid--CoA ligase bubblegum [Topomyia yanbarensis]XP_058821302.1 very long-chain-fatty-acid--CoA ligase bubblegum [Topomyia yanbarensis]
MSGLIKEEKFERIGRVLPAENYTTIDPAQPVKLRIAKEGIASMDPLSVPDLMNRTVRDYPDHTAMMYKNEQKVWQRITYREYRERVHKMAKVFIKLGLDSYHTVSVLAFNSPEWFISELAAIHAGGIITGVYTTNSAESTRHVLESSRTQIVIVDDAKQMEKIHSIKDSLPHLKVVIQTLGPYAPYVKKEDGYYRWSEVEEMNTDDVEEEFKTRLENLAINRCCCLVYTSGTVGNPKGVMLSHDSLTWDSYTIGKRLDQIQCGQEVLVSFLPLSHIAAQIVDIFLVLQFACTVYFADRDAMKGTLISTLQEAKPTRMLGVPRVYEKIYEKMMAVGSQSGAVKKMISGWAKSVTLQHYLDMIEGKPTNSLQYRFVRNYLLSKVKDALGFGRIMTLVTGAAPMDPEIKKYFMSLDLPVMDAFGMSETSGAHTLTAPDSYNFSTIGKTLGGCETRIDKPDENGHGELCFRGRNVLMGYVGEEEKTRAAMDEDGWLHSGDIGYIDDQGFVYITGRIKELIITAGGENVPPVHVENLVKNELLQVSNALLVGDKRKFLTMLITLKTVVDLDSGEPKDDLTPETIAWCKGLGVEYSKLSQIIAAGPCPKVMQAIQEGIDRANKKAISNAQKIQKFALLSVDFSVPGGEFGPTLKVKRNVVLEKYKNIIEKFYA